MELFHSSATKVELVRLFLRGPLREQLRRIIQENKDDFKDPRFRHRAICFRTAREWLAAHVEDEPSRAAGFAALDAFGACQGKKFIPDSAVAPIQRALYTAHTDVRNMAADMLLLLATQFEPARRVILESLRHPEERVRFSMISHFQFYPLPFVPEFVREVLEQALRDKSAKNRVAAVQGCDHYLLKELLPVLESTLLTEKNAQVVRSIRFHLPLIQYGYAIEREGGKARLIVRHRGGFRSKDVSEADLAPDNLKKVIERLQRGEVF